jgi:hypothetical protein
MSKHNRERGRESEREPGRGRENREPMWRDRESEYAQQQQGRGEWDRDWERNREQEQRREPWDRNWDRNREENQWLRERHDFRDNPRRNSDYNASRNPNQSSGRDYGRQYRTSDRMHGEADWGRNWGREYDARRGEDYDRYGMENQDWRHMDDYWRGTYGNAYPRENQQNRWTPNYSGRGPRNYKRTDARIMEDVNEQLTRHPAIDATEIDVAVTEGEVVLSGTVERREIKRMAEDVAESISGVKNVRNELKVQQQGTQKSGGGERAA